MFIRSALCDGVQHTEQVKVNIFLEAVTIKCGSNIRLYALLA